VTGRSDLPGFHARFSGIDNPGKSNRLPTHWLDSDPRRFRGPPALAIVQEKLEAGGVCFQGGREPDRFATTLKAGIARTRNFAAPDL